MLEKKADMKRRGLASPDLADALALTFAYPVMPSDHRGAFERKDSNTHQVGYNPFSRQHLQADYGTGMSNHTIDYKFNRN
jgi:hypothetical protein